MYKVVLTRSVKINGKFYKARETVENVSESLFKELEQLGLIESYEKKQTRSTKAKTAEKAGE